MKETSTFLPTTPTPTTKNSSFAAKDVDFPPLAENQAFLIREEKEENVSSPFEAADPSSLVTHLGGVSRGNLKSFVIHNIYTVFYIKSFSYF